MALLVSRDYTGYVCMRDSVLSNRSCYPRSPERSWSSPRADTSHNSSAGTPDSSFRFDSSFRSPQQQRPLLQNDPLATPAPSFRSSDSSFRSPSQRDGPQMQLQFDQPEEDDDSPMKIEPKNLLAVSALRRELTAELENEEEEDETTSSDF